MYLVDYKKLKIGDIILTGGKSVQGVAVKLFTLSKFSHAMIWVNGTLIHSDGGGVYSKNPQRLLFKSDYQVKILRIKEKLTSDQQNSIINYARSLIGTVYSTLDAVKVVVPFKLPMSEGQFCSRLVAQSYANADITIVKNKNFCSPAELDNSELFYEVTEAVRLASQADIDFANSRDVNLETQIDTISMLTKVRRKYGNSIQTIQDLVEFLLKNPSYDTDITKIAIESGYFNHAEVDMEVNSWRYNECEFTNRSVTHNIQTAQLIDEITHLNKSVGLLYEKELENYRRYLKMNHLDFFHLSIILYKQLVNTVYLRKDIAKAMLKKEKDSFIPCVSIKYF